MERQYLEINVPGDEETATFTNLCSPLNTPLDVAAADIVTTLRHLQFGFKPNDDLRETARLLAEVLIGDYRWSLGFADHTALAVTFTADTRVSLLAGAYATRPLPFTGSLDKFAEVVNVLRERRLADEALQYVREHQIDPQRYAPYALPDYAERAA